MPSLRRYPDTHAKQSKRGLYYVDYTLRRPDGSRERHRDSLGTRDPEEAERRYRYFLTEQWPRLVPSPEQPDGAVLPPDPTIQQLADWYTDTYQAARGDREITRTQNRTILRRFADYPRYARRMTIRR